LPFSIFIQIETDSITSDYGVMSHHLHLRVTIDISSTIDYDVRANERGAIRLANTDVQVMGLYSSLKTDPRWAPLAREIWN